MQSIISECKQLATNSPVYYVLKQKLLNVQNLLLSILLINENKKQKTTHSSCLDHFNSFGNKQFLSQICTSRGLAKTIS